MDKAFLYWVSSEAKPMHYRNMEETSCLSSKIYSFTALPHGWHYGEGKAPRLGLASMAVNVANMLCHIGAERLNVFPEVDGGVILNSDIEGKYYEFLCDAHGGIEISSEEDEAESRVVNLDELKVMLGDKKWENSYALYTRATTTTQEADSYHPHSVNQVRTKVSL